MLKTRLEDAPNYWVGSFFPQPLLLVKTSSQLETSQGSWCLYQTKGFSVFHPIPHTNTLPPPDPFPTAGVSYFWFFNNEPITRFLKEFMHGPDKETV